MRHQAGHRDDPVGRGGDKGAARQRRKENKTNEVGLFFWFPLCGSAALAGSGYTDFPTQVDWHTCLPNYQPLQGHHALQARHIARAGSVDRTVPELHVGQTSQKPGMVNKTEGSMEHGKIMF